MIDLSYKAVSFPEGGDAYATQQTQFQLTFFAKQFIQVIFFA